MFVKLTGGGPVHKHDCCPLIYCTHRHGVNTGSSVVERYFYSRFMNLWQGKIIMFWQETNERRKKQLVDVMQMLSCRGGGGSCKRVPTFVLFFSVKVLWSTDVSGAEAGLLTLRMRSAGIRMKWTGSVAVLFGRWLKQWLKGFLCGHNIRGCNHAGDSVSCA